VDRLEHANCVVVAWTRTSIKSDWVQDEAQSGAERGVLIPVRLDRVEPPLGFRAFQYSDLAGWKGGRHSEVDRLLRDVAHLISGVVDVPRGQDLRHGRHYAQGGVSQARIFFRQIRAQSAMFKANPEAAVALGHALSEVDSTIAVAQRAVDDFLAPLTTRREITIARYRPLATGRLIADVEAKRGHCTQIAETYIAEGGLRDQLPESIEADVVEALDDIFDGLAGSDADLFSAMADIGQQLERESAAIVNMLLCRRHAAAQARLERADKLLVPLVRDLNRAHAEFNRLTGTLGLTST
jgi:hypothetical protein